MDLIILESLTNIRCWPLGYRTQDAMCVWLTMWPEVQKNPLTLMFMVSLVNFRFHCKSYHQFLKRLLDFWFLLLTTEKILEKKDLFWMFLMFFPFSASHHYRPEPWDCDCGGEQFCVSLLWSHRFPPTHLELAEWQRPHSGQLQCTHHARYRLGFIENEHWALTNNWSHFEIHLRNMNMSAA